MNNLNRIELIIECFCNKNITAEQMCNLINEWKMKAITQQKAIQMIKSCGEEVVFCPYCMCPLTNVVEGVYYCPNDMCLNEYPVINGKILDEFELADIERKDKGVIYD